MKRPKRIAFDGEDSKWGFLSRDGQTLCTYNGNVTHVYQVREEAGKDPIGFMKFKLNGIPRAVSGKSNRVIVALPRKLEIYDIGKDAGKLVCRIDNTGFVNTCALNEDDGSRAAFVIKNRELRIVEVDKIGNSVMNQSTIAKVKGPESLAQIYKLVYSDGGKLHVLHVGGKVSLFNPSTNELVFLEAPQEGQKVVNSAISPDADYIAFLQERGKRKNGNHIFRTIVKRKFNDTDWMGIFGYKAPITKNKLQSRERNAGIQRIHQQ